METLQCYFTSEELKDPKTIYWNWYFDCAFGFHDGDGADSFDGVIYLLKRLALQQMWRVLKTDGELIIVDVPRTINWIISQGPKLLEIDADALKITGLDIGDDDEIRSLGVRNQHTDAEKICLRKVK